MIYLMIVYTKLNQWCKFWEYLTRLNLMNAIVSRLKIYGIEHWVIFMRK